MVQGRDGREQRPTSGANTGGGRQPVSCVPLSTGCAVALDMCVGDGCTHRFEGDHAWSLGHDACRLLGNC